MYRHQCVLLPVTAAFEIFLYIAERFFNLDWVAVCSIEDSMLRLYRWIAVLLMEVLAL